MFRERNTNANTTTQEFRTLGVTAQSVIENLAARMSKGGQTFRAAGAIRAPRLPHSGKPRN